MTSSRTILSCALLGALTLNAGCTNIWHNLRPHRLQRLNRGPAPSLDPEFSSLHRKMPTRIAKRCSPTAAPKMTANCTEIAVVRAQSTDAAN